MNAIISILLLTFISLIFSIGSSQPADGVCKEDGEDTCSTLSASNNTMLYSIILPTYNERDNLPLITQFIHDTFTDAKLNYEIVVVDDSSPDNTLEVAKDLQKIFGNI